MPQDPEPSPHLPFLAARWAFGHVRATYVARLKPARYAELVMKERALSRLQQPEVSVRRYRARDSLMEFLKML